MRILFSFVYFFLETIFSK